MKTETMRTDAAEIAHMLIEVERERLQTRIDACLERAGGDVEKAVTSSGIGISYLFAKELVRALDHAEAEIGRLRDEIGSLRADLDGAAHNRFYNQRDAYFEGKNDAK